MSVEAGPARARDRIGGVSGVIIWTAADRFAAMRAFYLDTLGLSVRSDRAGFINFEWGALRLTVTVHSELDGPSRDPLRTMLNFQVDDIAAVHARLLTAGVEFVRPPEREHFGGRFATFHDPDGNTLQLMQLPA